MNIVKKIAGVLLLIFATLLSLGTLVSIFNGVNDSIREIKESTIMGISYAFGSLFGAAILISIIYFTAKLGLKLIRKKEVEVDSIDEIGI
jgi:hypothetical protein